jgi:hypothetical protein
MQHGRPANNNRAALAIVILVVLALCGLAIASAGRADPLGVHGLIAVLASGGPTGRVARSVAEPLPDLVFVALDPLVLLLMKPDRVVGIAVLRRVPLEGLLGEIEGHA